jgi:hypothetical protein
MDTFAVENGRGTGSHWDIATDAAACDRRSRDLD